MKVSVIFILIILFSSVNLEKLEQQEDPTPVPFLEIIPSVLKRKDEVQDVSKTKRSSINEISEKGECECAVFKTQTPEANATPFISRFPLKVSCDEFGKKQCQELCLALARAAGERASQALCATVGHVFKLQPSIFTRVCKENVYTFSGVTASEVYCCHDHVPVNCNDTEDVNK